MRIMLLLRMTLILLGPVRRVQVPPLADDAFACFADDASVVSSVFMVAIWKRRGVARTVTLMDDAAVTVGIEVTRNDLFIFYAHVPLDSRWR